MKREHSSLVALFLIVACAAAAQSSPGFKVVASTSWTAAFARAAGATDIATIAPLELRHPPEYELKPSDLMAVHGARFLVHSGYERFAARLSETAGAEGLEVIQVYTDNLPSKFKEEAQKLALRFGTLPAYEAWEKGFDAMTETMRLRVQAAYPDRRAAVHKYLRTYAEWLGFEVVGTFGPGEPAPAVLLELAKAKPALVIDNYHNASGKAVAQATGAPMVELINFPGKDGTRTIEEVFARNERVLVEAVARR
jgi:hypothetical protein